MKSEEEKLEVKGAFVGSLKRTATDIKNDRAESIAEDAELSYRRCIEDMENNLRKLKKNRRNSLDLSPTDINSLVMGKDFDGEAFAETDIKAGFEVKKLEVKIQIAKERYEYLFGEYPGTTAVEKKDEASVLG